MPSDNHCRYEGGSTRPWCYTMDPNVRVGYCSTCGDFDPWENDVSIDSISDDEETTTIAGTATTTTVFTTEARVFTI